MIKNLKQLHLILLFLAFLFAGCKNNTNSLPDGIYAVIVTNKGEIICNLAFEKTPVTVASFVSLAEGKNNFTLPNFKGKKFFDGLTFHRVVPDFVVQGGDPLGNGSGGPGYNFIDEFTDLTHDSAGILSMANAGPGTNGSQFFITLNPQPQLDGLHTVFGYVVTGMDVVKQIKVGDSIQSVQIIKNGERAKKFSAPAIFEKYVAEEKEKQILKEKTLAKQKLAYDTKYKSVLSEKKESFHLLKKQASKTKTGLLYCIQKRGTGKKAIKGSKIQVHYAGYLEDGHLFDTSKEEIAKQFGMFDQNRKSSMGYNPLTLEAGRRQGLIPGFEEALTLLNIGDQAIVYIPAALGYGPQGAGDIIPPNANLIFEIEIVKPTK